MKKLRRRLGLDLVLTVMLCTEMFFEVTGDTLHEIIGAALLATICGHLILSRKWIKTTAGKIRGGKALKRAHKTSLAVNVALAVAFGALAASSIAISQLLSGMTGIWIMGSARSIWVAIHTVGSYGLCALVVIHLLLHWSSIAAAVRIPYDPARRQAINTGASALAAVSVIALGLAGADALTAQFAPSMPTADAKTTNIPDAGEQVSNASESTQTSAQAAPVNMQAEAQSDKPAPSGVCPLCKKHCPLSDPGCDRPYEAGLI